MSDFELYVSDSAVFGGRKSPLEQANYVIVGVPLDMSSSYRSGARFAPLAVREASLNIETYSFRSDLDFVDLKIHDLGDIHISGDIETSLRRVEGVTKDLLRMKKLPVLIGGEHTITLGAARGIDGRSAAVISFDAHLDLRSEYMGLDLCHATFMRRLKEQVRPEVIIEMGTRAVCKEELTYADEAGVNYFTIKHIQDVGLEAAANAAKEIAEGCTRTYLTVDMDVLDPAYAPAVQNPEPEGLSTQALLNLVSKFCDSRLVGLDLVEISPSYDAGATAVHGAKILLEALCQVERNRVR